MGDFLTALGLALVIEGVLYAAFPKQMRAMLEAAFASGDGLVRRAGLTTALIGLALVWLVRG